MTAHVSKLLKSRAAPEVLSFSLCNKKRLAVRHMNRPLFPTTLSIPSYDIGKCVRLRTYQHPFILHRSSRFILGFKTCCFYQKDKREKFGNVPNKQLFYGNQGILDRKVLSLSLWRVKSRTQKRVLQKRLLRRIWTSTKKVKGYWRIQHKRSVITFIQHQTPLQ